ncbi:hypothetical protein ACWD62_04305 [Streptomyces sp. NPDC005146]
MGVSNEYNKAHRAVADERGKASVSQCVWCGGFADEWAYDWSDPNEHSENGRVWSDNPDRYAPLCGPDHRAFDKAYRRVGLAGLAAEIAPLKAEASKRYDAEERAFIERTCIEYAILNERVRRKDAEERLARLKEKSAQMRAELEMRQRLTDEREWKASDPLAGFFPGLFEVGEPTDSILGAELFDVYADWCTRICNRLGIRVIVPMRRTSFYRALEGRGATRRKTAQGIMICGIKAP